MCPDYKDHVEDITEFLGTALSQEGIPPEVVFGALHALARVIESQTRMPSSLMARLQFLGRDVGEELLAQMDIAEAEAQAVERDLLTTATMELHRTKPN